METAVNLVINSLVLSSMYILVALGFAFAISIMGIFNFAHGALYMVGGYICYQLAGSFGLNQWLSLVLAAIILGSFGGFFLERYCFRPFSGDLNRTIVISVAIILLIETTANILFGVHVQSIPPYISEILKIGTISISADRILTIIIGVFLLSTLAFFIRWSKTGQQMLAVSQEPEGAILQGIRTHRISAIALAIGCALAAVAGSLMGSLFELSAFMGDYMLIKSIQLVILGGIGSISGVLVGGLIIGIIDASLPLLTNAAVTEFVGLMIVIAILVFRPQGFFGREV